MPTRRINEDNVWILKTCSDPEHNPPAHLAPPPGLYEHECPSCGHTVRFRVTGVRMMVEDAIRRAKEMLQDWKGGRAV